MLSLSTLKALGNIDMMVTNTIKVPLHTGFVTNGIRWFVLAFALTALRAAANDAPIAEKPPAEIVLGTSVYTQCAHHSSDLHTKPSAFSIRSNARSTEPITNR